MNDEIISLYEKLSKLKIYYKKTIDKWKELNPQLNSQQKIELIKLFCNEDVFRWLPLISELITEIAPENKSNYEDFIEVIKIVIDKIKDDMAQGTFIEALIKIGYEYPDATKSIATELTDNLRNSIYAGFIVGGISKHNFNFLVNYKRDISNQNMKIVILVALSTSLKNKKLTNDERIFTEEVLTDFSNTGETIEVKIQALFLNFDLYHDLKDLCYENILTLANSENNPRILFPIAERLWVQGLNNDIEREFELINICSRNEDKNVLDRVMLYLSIKGTKRPKFTIEIIARLTLSGLDFKINSFDYALKEIGKTNIVIIEKELKSYLKKCTLDTFSIHKLSYTIDKLYNDHINELYKFIKYLENEKDGDKKKLAEMLKNRRFSIIDLDFIVSEEIEKWSKSKQYPSSVAIEVDDKKTEIIDFVIITEVGEIPIELVSILISPFSDKLIDQIRQRMLKIMSLIKADLSLLILLSPTVTKEAIEELKRPIEGKKIDVIYDKDIHSIREKFKKYLGAVKPKL